MVEDKRTVSSAQSDPPPDAVVSDMTQSASSITPHTVKDSETEIATVANKKL